MSVKQAPRAPLRTEEEVQQLVGKNRRLVDYMVNRYLKRYHVGNMERDDLVSWGTMGLINAARAYDPSRGTAFSTLACRAIERMIVRGVSREWRADQAGRTVSLDELISGSGEEGDDRFIDQLASGDDLEQDLVDRQRIVDLREAIRQLPPEKQQIIERHFFREESVKDIAADLGLTRQGVYSREKAIFRELRESLNRLTTQAA